MPRVPVRPWRKPAILRPPRPAPPRCAQPTRPRILVVEDEPIAREILGDLLKMAGYDVLSAHTGEQALLLLVQERGRIDCLFTAVELPGLVDGWMLADEFRV